jgi:hypothetical protein
MTSKRLASSQPIKGDHDIKIVDMGLSLEMSVDTAVLDKMWPEHGSRKSPNMRRSPRTSPRSSPHLQRFAQLHSCHLCGVVLQHLSQSLHGGVE